jgi:protein O-GlcNAc transferase
MDKLRETLLARPAVTIGVAVLLVALLVLGVFLWPGSPLTPAGNSELASARAALQAGDTGKAVAELEAFVAREPTSVEAHTLLAQAYQKADRTEEALEEYQAAIILSPDEVPDYILDPNDIGAALYQKGELDQAIRQLQAALALAPNDPETHYLLGAAYIQQSQLAEAEAEFNKALAAKPDMAEAHIGLGNVQLLKGELEPATASFQKAVAINPSLPEAYLPLGKVLAAQGDTAGARDALNAFLKLNPPAERRQEAEQVLSQLGQ